ncbi:tRNA uridine-5-carboxymethylaminomethyl(34) synthesis GTPase MnmE [Desulfallas thermosapovorans]|uniref:tRNA modification GTPase MnmE n=1 Tax=Desulfallas thermosapovorans DSM 6562 TaxID=1121431 RepID=A0A5S4ZUE9_9FIRM|nr:tRNA uridine-5-carboxymethylaminomethyl(34) synthesis GTPase MnmE [Desulfallas thermosapovorans]TYO96422.1 tRNA modification GTPase trmE [Desulfallas thermosapovorans DSM 6562]
MIGDTIAAISTPPGEGAIGIVRLSGPEAIVITEKIFRAAKNKDWSRQNFKLVYGYIYSPETKNVIDEVLVGIMRAPYSYTKEDVVEINCHGGALPLRKILELVLNLGARLAEPGEFTKRAFLNGRLDLIQAESIIDIIRASTDDAMRLAVGQLSGGLSDKITAIQQQLLQITALIEANIDFPEEDVDEYNLTDIKLQVEQIMQEIKKLLENAETGKIYREGLRTVIIGKPNVGKSSLLNVLLKENRAIVTDIPGTTRDLIEEVINIGGIPLKIIDTAGIRETEDVIEKIGVQKTRESIKAADFIIMVFDALDGINEIDNEIIKLVQPKKGVKVLNKIDLQEQENPSLKEQLKIILPDWPLVDISALEERNIEKLEQEIVNMVTRGQVIPGDGIMVSNVRHKNQLVKALQHLTDVRDAIEQGMSLDLIAVDIRGAWEAVSEINGTAVTEHIVDKIFADFCIGK